MTTSRIRLTLMIAMTAVAICGTSYAQTLIGSAGAGWQTWNLAVNPTDDHNYVDLNSNGAPYWDVPLLTFGDLATGGTFNGTSVSTGQNFANKSVGWCLTSTGDCQGVGSALVAPGPLPFWGMAYNSATDTGGAMDPAVYFSTGRNTGDPTYQATLYLNSATNTVEINEFGWFETNSTGTVNGARHVLFQGAGNPPGTNTPDPVGKVVTFSPTQYFGFYFQDVSDPQTVTPYQGCLAFTIFAFNDPDCTAAGTSSYGTGQGDHVFAIFAQMVSGRPSVYWIAGQDPATCDADGDCNLTIVKVRPVTRD